METVEEAGKGDELGKVHKKSEYVAEDPILEEIIDGKTIRVFNYRSEAMAWAVHNGKTFAYYHSSLWEVFGLDDDGLESVKTWVGDPFEAKVVELIQSKITITL